MSGETEDNVPGWTVDTLRAHILALLAERDLRYEQRFDAQERAGELALAAQAEATKVQEITAQRWRDQANEWREAMNDRERMFMPRHEAERIVNTNTERIGTMAATISARIDVVADQIDKLEKRQDLREGRSAGLNAGWTYLGGAIAVAAAAVGIIIGTR
jgi:hypothetical protein